MTSYGFYSSEPNSHSPGNESRNDPNKWVKDSSTRRRSLLPKRLCRHLGLLQKNVAGLIILLNFWRL